MIAIERHTCPSLLFLPLFHPIVEPFPALPFERAAVPHLLAKEFCHLNPLLQVLPLIARGIAVHQSVAELLNVGLPLLLCAVESYYLQS
jgi:hypothetical protein